MRTESTPKKKISEKRRQQNKQAQKKYRERQKKELQVLQNIATSSYISKRQVVADRAQNVVREQAPWNNSPSEASSIWDGDDTVSPGQAPLPGLRSCLSISEASTPSLLELSAKDQLSGSDEQQSASPDHHTGITDKRSQIHHLLQDKGINFDEKTMLRLLEETKALENLLQAGLKALSNASSSLETYPSAQDESQTTTLKTDKLLILKNTKNEYNPSLPDIRKNNLRIKQITFVAACIANASSLGFVMPGPDTDCEEIESPFYNPSFSHSSARTQSKTLYPNLSPSLHPTTIQITHSHHPYIDVLPFPSFRERVIKLACGPDAIIDEEELCADLMNDGLVCWGSSLGGGSSAMGSGAPWDVRSWEAQGWFLRKWWVLVGGREGELYKQSKWWCEMRGEKGCCGW